MKVFTPFEYEWKGTRLARFIARYGYGSLDQLQEDAESDAPAFWDRVLDEIDLQWQCLRTRRRWICRREMWPEWFVGGSLISYRQHRRKAREAKESAKDRNTLGGRCGEDRQHHLQLSSMTEVARVAAGLCGLGLNGR
jgi:acetyl-CoA synthetase